MPFEFILIVAAAVIFLAGAVFIIIALQWRSGRSDRLFQQHLLDMARQLGDAREKQESLARLLSEGQVKNLEALQEQFSAAVETMNRQLGTVTNTLNEQLARTQGNIGRQLEGTQKVVSQVQERLGELTVTAQNIQELGKDIARLQDVLQAPKLRGNIGELFLEELLSQVLPARNFETQYSFTSGEKVDAVIRLGNQLVPVDSKFPLESFNRLREAETEDDRKKARREFAASVRKRVDEIANKYIRPEEGTYDFALMYIPAENVFYEVIIRDEAIGEEKGIFNYALQRHIIPVSPNSFYAYLMALAYGLKGLQIEKHAQEIRGQLGQLHIGLEKFFEDFQLVGKHLDNAKSKHVEADRKLERLHDNFRQITRGEEIT